MVSTPWAWPVTTGSRLPSETGPDRMLGSRYSRRPVLPDGILARRQQPIMVMALARRSPKPLWWPALSFAILRGRRVCQTMRLHFRTTLRCFIETLVVVWLCMVSGPNRQEQSQSFWLIRTIRAPLLIREEQAVCLVTGEVPSRVLPFQ